MPIENIDDKTQANHIDATLSIYTMVLNRLPILTDNDANKLLISNFILEIMYELNHCFKIEDAAIGIEANYSVIQQSIIADIVSVYILISIFAQNMSGGTTDIETGETSGGNNALTKAKAG